MTLVHVASEDAVVYRADPRFSYALALPPHDPARGSPGLIVTVHHTLRNVIECRDRFAVFAAAQYQVVLAPLFPQGVFGDGNADGYKYMLERDLRYDLLLNGMIDEVVHRTGCRADRFCLQGYSGGAHFAQRYLLLHPHRLRAVSIGAPGQVTALDADQPWWAGIQDFETRFGQALRIDAMRQVPTQLLVGDEDTDTHAIGPAGASRFWASDTERRHADRIARLKMLCRSYEAAGLQPVFETMPGIRHIDGTPPAIARAQAFFERYLGPR